MAKIISGKDISATIRAEIKDEISALREKYEGRTPGLAVILVGDRRDSKAYVSMKNKAAAEVGIKSFNTTLPADTTQEELIRIVREYNDNPEVHGILIQLPLPAHINEETVLNTVAPSKDVDGFHAENIALIGMRGRSPPLFVPCTPKGCIELLDRENVDIAGKHAVVVGRSNIVGLPVSLLLLQRNATVTVCHSQTKNIPEHVRQADIVIAACGRAEMIRGDWLKPGAVVIDVGMNSVDDPSSAKGYKLVGDVAYDEAVKVASAITPVPGGVGPMTIAMLLSNTLQSFKRHVQ